MSTWPDLPANIDTNALVGMLREPGGVLDRYRRNCPNTQVFQTYPWPWTVMEVFIEGELKSVDQGSHLKLIVDYARSRLSESPINIDKTFCTSLALAPDDAKEFLVLCLHVIVLYLFPEAVQAKHVTLGVFQAEMRWDESKMSPAEWAVALAFRNNLVVSLHIVQPIRLDLVLKRCCSILSGVFTLAFGGKGQAQEKQRFAEIYLHFVPKEKNVSPHDQLLLAV